LGLSGWPAPPRRRAAPRKFLGQAAQHGQASSMKPAHGCPRAPASKQAASPWSGGAASLVAYGGGDDGCGSGAPVDEGPA
jgi:hypothetical protein